MFARLINWLFGGGRGGDKSVPRPQRALIVGINTYNPPFSSLSGCVNDARMMSDMLVSTFQWEPENIRLLVDERATTSAILERLQWLTEVDPDGMAFLHFSGHGTQIATRDRRHEVDGLSEVFCPADFDWRSDRMLVDQQLAAILSKMRTSRFCWFSDSCHSGDLQRTIRRGKKTPPPFAPRYIQPPADLEWRLRVASERGIQKRSLNGSFRGAFVSGCRSDQTSADTVINGVPCGAFTWHMAKFLQSPAHRKQSMQQAADMVSRWLSAAGYTQRPTAAGTEKDKPFLG